MEVVLDIHIKKMILHQLEEMIHKRNNSIVKIMVQHMEDIIIEIIHLIEHHQINII